MQTFDERTPLLCVYFNALIITVPFIPHSLCVCVRACVCLSSSTRMFSLPYYSVPINIHYHTGMCSLCVPQRVIFKMLMLDFKETGGGLIDHNQLLWSDRRKEEPPRPPSISLKEKKLNQTKLAVAPNDCAADVSDTCPVSAHLISIHVCGGGWLHRCAKGSPGGFGRRQSCHGAGVQRGPRSTHLSQ